MSCGVKYSKKAGSWMYFENKNKKDQPDERRYFDSKDEAEAYQKEMCKK